MSKLEGVTVEPGFLVISTNSGPPRQWPIKDVLRAADIPVLTISSLTLLTKLAQVVSVLTQTLIENGTISEELAEEYDMDYVVSTLVDDLEAEFGGS